jgi:hypothetical protein
MSAGPRICVFYSKGRTYVDVLRCVAKAFPNAQLVAVIPAGYPLSPEETSLSAEVVMTESTRYSARQPGALLRLVRQLRAARYDTFVILFDSPRLRIFSALSRAKERLHCRMDGQLVPVTASIPGTMLDVAWRNVKGRIVYRWIWLVVRCCKARFIPPQM